MDRIVKSKILLFLIALFIPFVAFLIMAYMMSMLLKGCAGLSVYICVTIITCLLIASAEQINEDVGSALATTIGILIGTAILFLFFSLFTDECGYKVEFGEKGKTIILLIYGWALSVFMWTYNLFKKQKQLEIPELNSEIKDNEDLIGGWYEVDSKSSYWFPVLAFEQDYTATFSDGKIVKEYSYHICCSTCIIFTTKEGEKAYVERVWIDEKPHLLYNGQIFTQDGKYAE